MKEEEHLKAAIRLAATILVEAVVDLLQNDPHQWSTRPCSTCTAVSGVLGKPFGCLKYKEEKEL